MVDFYRKGAESGFGEQYSDGKAARVWEKYIGGTQRRTDQYRRWIVDLLRDNGCRHVLDTACGTGIDSVMLVEEGFQVVSTDASDRMLKYALRQRWKRRKEPAFDRWIIEEANWLTLVDDVQHMEDVQPGTRFDAVLCLGNSLSALSDFDGGLAAQRRAIGNFWALVRPGGLLVIDHRNYNCILETGIFPSSNIYYDYGDATEVSCSLLYKDGRAVWLTADYTMDVSSLAKESGCALDQQKEFKFAISSYPFTLKDFSALLRDVLNPDVQDTVFGDFKPLGEIDQPGYYIHVVKKQLAD